MKIISTNIGQRKSVVWKGEMLETGFFKYPVHHAIELGETDVLKDNVVDRKHHGGIDKACYIYSADHYSFWKKLFPEVDLTYGAFGENLTLQGLNEKDIRIGDRFEIGKKGDVIVEVAQPRQPCMKLGIRFNTQKVIKAFVNQPYPGIYLRILKTGEVNTGDTFQLIHGNEKNLSIAEVHGLLSKQKDLRLAKKAIQMDDLAESYKKEIKRLYQL
ncbi:MOSC domain-containing protein [Parvicella tangerina]|uniref:MOSC domain-containing protein n=1 Tax=Parvicella tangerina TaxID=2829795 RepID=A0A916ND05_9FLAO|nr:MOSC domain-containing protein [Parvicella tangerina]CAG5084199.1 hypothetical protein CRYO30217_02403 [Parvicella tangerina]